MASADCAQIARRSYPSRITSHNSRNGSQPWNSESPRAYEEHSLRRAKLGSESATVPEVHR